MKLPSFALFCSWLMAKSAVAELECTHGKLFLSSTDDATVRIFDVSDGNLANLVQETTMDVPGAAGPGVSFGLTSDGATVAAIYRGMEEKFYSDGVVSWINTGVRVESHGDHDAVEYGPLSMVENAQFQCARAIHFVRHNGDIAIFCDGSFDADPTINSTVWVLDEDKFGSATESAIIHNITLEGSHHGVAISVDEDHLLYSLPVEDRLNGVEGSTSLPATFQVVDYEGNVLHEIADTASPDTSCSGFHGEAVQADTFALACDVEHGGILRIDYASPSMSYQTRALEYPDSFPEHRTGSFTDHHEQEYVVGNFGGSGSYNLMAFKQSETVLTEDHVLSLGTERQCGFAYEVGHGEYVMVLMPNGMLHAFSIPDFTELAKVQVVEGMQACTEAELIPGVAQAFVLHIPTKTLFAVDLEHVDDGEMEITSSQLDFTPYEGIVGGIPPTAMCGEDDHGHGTKQPTPSTPAPTPSAGSNKTTRLGLGLVATVGALFM